MTILGGKLQLRPSEPADLAFLARVYASSRNEEMSQVVDWTEAQKEAFLQSQFDLQHRHYHEHYPTADYCIVLEDGVAIGRLYVDRWDAEIRLMDVALLPESRNRGVGGLLMRDLVAESERTGKLLSCHVEETNPARRLYERLGFIEVGEQSFYKRMERRPAQQSSSPGLGNRT